MNPILISSPTNIRYLTGFAGLSPSEREAYVLVMDTYRYLFTNPLYREEAKSLSTKTGVTGCELRVVEISRDYPFSTALAVICQKEGIQKLEFEENDLTVTEFENLKNALKRVTLIHSKHRIEDMRRCKRKDEIDFIKKASDLTDECYTAILKLLVPGVFESEIALIIESFFRRQGASIAFFPIVAFGTNTSKPHYEPDGKGAQLNETDIVLLDFGARVGGYCSDMTRMVFIGAPKQEWKHAYETLYSAQMKVVKAMENSVKASMRQGKKKEVYGSELDKIARKEIESAGYPTYPHSLGHALGLDIHESPRLHKDTDTQLLPGMVITIEPGIYIEGSFGMRIEDTIVLTESEIEILTHTSKEILVI